MTRRLLPLLAAFAIAGGFVYLLLWFDRTDFYHGEFFEPGSKVILYNLARLLFIPYMAWIVYAPGAGLIALVSGRRALGALMAWERYPLGFIAGAGIWHFLLFGCGLAGLYVKPVAVLLSVGAMFMSVPHLAVCLRELAATLRQVRPRVALKSLGVGAIAAGIACSAAAFLLIKGLYPNGGSDYIGHYFYFYKRVVETGSILPNDVWYHFFYSKGLGLYFLSMLLTDALAPQLVASGFIGIGALIVFGILRHASRGGLLPYAGVLLYLLLLIYTPGPAENAAHAGWGDLEKTHELTAVLLLAIAWISSRLSETTDTSQGPWLAALLGAIISISLITLPLTLLAGVYMMGYLLWFAVRRQWNQATWPLAAGLTAVLSVAVMASINYVYTGLPSDQGMLLFWPYANMKPLQEWGILLEIIWGHWYNTIYQLQSAPWTLNLVPLLWKFLRLEIWWPIAAAALPFLALRLRSRAGWNTLDWHRGRAVWWALVWFAAVVILAALFGGGRSQHISFYRLSSFSYGPTLCLVLLLWGWAFDRREHAQRKLTRWAMVAAGIALPVVLATSALPAEHRETIKNNVRSIAVDSWRLGTGKHSVKDAYQHQQGRPGRSPWGGIYEGIVPAWRIAGPNARIWAFHPGSVCMLPDCNLQGFPAMRLSRQWEVVFFGSPEQAVQVLKSEGLNFFFFTKDLGVADVLPAARLFSPEIIGRYLAVRWSDGTSYLLSWPGPDTKPIDESFLAAYSKALSTSGLYQPFKARIADWKAISLYLSAHRADLHPFYLPWCRTCDGMPPIDYGALLKANP